MTKKFKSGDLVKPIAWDDFDVGIVLDAFQRYATVHSRNQQQCCKVQWSEKTITLEWSSKLELVSHAKDDK